LRALIFIVTPMGRGFQQSQPKSKIQSTFLLAILRIHRDAAFGFQEARYSGYTVSPAPVFNLNPRPVLSPVEAWL
jgi:hypothetical protein